jgi:hypothetical protein
VATHKTISSFGKAFEKRLEKVILGAHQVHKLLSDGGKEDHFEFTDGGISTKELRRMGHPYGRTAGGQRGNINKKIKRRKILPLPINKQKGDLRASFYKKDKNGRDRVSRMGFSAPYAKYLLRPGGTWKMIDRKFYSIGGAKSGMATGIIRKRFNQRLIIAKRVYKKTIKS